MLGTPLRRYSTLMSTLRRRAKTGIPCSPISPSSLGYLSTSMLNISGVLARGQAGKGWNFRSSDRGQRVKQKRNGIFPRTRPLASQLPRPSLIAITCFPRLSSDIFGTVEVAVRHHDLCRTPDGSKNGNRQNAGLVIVLLLCRVR